MAQLFIIDTTKLLISCPKHTLLFSHPLICWHQVVPRTFLPPITHSGSLFALSMEPQLCVLTREVMIGGGILIKWFVLVVWLWCSLRITFNVYTVGAKHTKGREPCELQTNRVINASTGKRMVWGRLSQAGTIMACGSCQSLGGRGFTCNCMAW